MSCFGPQALATVPYVSFLLVRAQWYLTYYSIQSQYNETHKKQFTICFTSNSRGRKVTNDFLTVTTECLQLLSNDTPMSLTDIFFAFRSII